VFDGSLKKPSIKFKKNNFKKGGIRMLKFLGLTASDFIIMIFVSLGLAGLGLLAFIQI
jgi:hypothetical protein